MLTPPNLRPGYDASSDTDYLTAPESLNTVVGISNERRDGLRKVFAWVVCAAILAGVGWTGASCLRQTEDPRPMTTAEADRLSRVNVHNYRAGAVAFTATLPDSVGGGLDGRIDWSQPVLHAAVTPEGDSTPQRLVQAVPGLVATRDGDTEAEAATPRDGWSVRHMSRDNPAGKQALAATVDIIASALLTLRADGAADAKAIQSKGSWLRQGVIDGATVDVFRAPLLLDAAGDEARKLPEAVFWVDADARLRRIQFDPGATSLATVDFLLSRKDVEAPAPIDMLGGAPIDPRKVTAAEADQLAGLRQRNSLGGATARVRLPVADGKIIEARGYVDWRIPMAYLAVDAPGRKNDGLLIVLPSGAATRSQKVNGKPPLTPDDTDWKAQKWSQRTTEDGKASELDTLLFKVLSMSTGTVDDVKTVKKKASWLREDSLGDTTTDVFEYPITGDAKAKARGQAPFRYWVGTKDDALHRIEMRTGKLGMALVDLEPADEPAAVVIPPSVVAGFGG